MTSSWWGIRTKYVVPDHGLLAQCRIQLPHQGEPVSSPGNCPFLTTTGLRYPVAGRTLARAWPRRYSGWHDTAHFGHQPAAGTTVSRGPRHGRSVHRPRRAGRSHRAGARHSNHGDGEEASSRCRSYGCDRTEPPAPGDAEAPGPVWLSPQLSRAALRGDSLLLRPGQRPSG